MIEGAAEAIKLINKVDILLLWSLNQPVIACGEVSWDELNEIHRKMETLLGKDGAYLDGIYILSSSSEQGASKVSDRNIRSSATAAKPTPGLLLRAAKDFNIDLSQSFMIGDSQRDVDAGINAKVSKSLEVGTNLLIRY